MCASSALEVVFSIFRTIRHCGLGKTNGCRSLVCKMPNGFVSVWQDIFAVDIHGATTIDVSFELYGLGPDYVVLNTPRHLAGNFIGQEWILAVAANVQE